MHVLRSLRRAFAPVDPPVRKVAPRHALPAVRAAPATLVLLLVARGALAQDSGQAARNLPAALGSDYAKAMRVIAASVARAKPWIKRRPIVAADGGIRTGGEQITAADEKGITVTIVGRQGQETAQRGWDSLSDDAIASLLREVVDQQSGDECVAAGMICLARSQPSEAAAHFERAGKLGADVARYQAPLAASAFAEAKALVAKSEFAKAAAALETLTERYPSWADSHKAEIRHTLSQAEAADREALAADLLGRGRELCKSECIWDRWDLRIVCDGLKTKCPRAEGVRKAEAELAQWAELTSSLGDMIIVRKQGGGHVKAISEAIEMARPNSLIQIEDSELYNEKIVIPKQKEGLLLRGGADCWPVITSMGERKGIDILVRVEAKDTTLDRLLLIHPATAAKHCLSVDADAFTARRTAIFMSGSRGITTALSFRYVSLVDSIIVADVDLRCASKVVNSVIINLDTFLDRPTKCEQSTFLCPIRNNHGGVLSACIVGKQTRGPANLRLDNCNLCGSITASIQPDKNCFKERPRFTDAKRLDFTPVKSSQCGKRGVGCRYTPEMEEMRKRMLALIEKGVFKL